MNLGFFRLIFSVFALGIVSYAHAGVIYTDAFSVDGAPGAEWVGVAEDGAAVSVSTGLLNVTTPTVTGLTPRYTLHLQGAGAPIFTLASDWTVETSITIESAASFVTMAGGEGVGASIDVRNSLPFTSDRAQVNVVALNFGGGADHGLRGAGQTNGSSDTETITNLGAASSALNVVVRIAYDAANDQISFGADTGGGFVTLTAPMTTTGWAMTDSDPLELRLELGMVSFSGDPATSTFAVDSGEVMVDYVTIHDETLATNTVPEPSGALLLIAGSCGLWLRRRR